MSSKGRRPKLKVTKTFFFCDRKKCSVCNPKCKWTQDPRHALSLEGEFRQSLTDGSMWQSNISVNGVILNDSSGPGRLTLL